MITSHGIGENTTRDLSRLIRPALSPTNERHGRAGGYETVPSQPHDMGSPHGWRRGAVICSLGVGQGLGVFSQKVEGGAKNPIRHRESDAVGRTLDNRLGSAAESNRPVKVLQAVTNTSQASKGAQLIVEIPKAFGQRLRKCRACSIVRAL